MLYYGDFVVVRVWKIVVFFMCEVKEFIKFMF